MKWQGSKRTSTQLLTPLGTAHLYPARYNRDQHFCAVQLKFRSTLPSFAAGEGQDELSQAYDPVGTIPDHKRDVAGQGHNSCIYATHCRLMVRSALPHSCPWGQLNSAPRANSILLPRLGTGPAPLSSASGKRYGQLSRALQAMVNRDSSLHSWQEPILPASVKACLSGIVKADQHLLPDFPACWHMEL